MDIDKGTKWNRRRERENQSAVHNLMAFRWREIFFTIFFLSFIRLRVKKFGDPHHVHERGYFQFLCTVLNKSTFAYTFWGHFSSLSFNYCDIICTHSLVHSKWQREVELLVYECNVYHDSSTCYASNIIFHEWKALDKFYFSHVHVRQT